jgi:hypothetical protein
MFYPSPVAAGRSEMWRVIKVRALPEYRLQVEFEDGVRGILEYRNELTGEVFEALRDPVQFAKVGIDEDGVVCWPNGTDLAPDAMYEDLKAQQGPGSVAGGTESFELPESDKETRPLPRWRPAPAVGASSGGETIPRISRFFGITISMHWREHGVGHFHVEYGTDQATLAIETFEVLAGRLPRRVMSLVLEWALIHRPELRANWARAQRKEPLLPVRPLDEEA